MTKTERHELKCLMNELTNASYEYGLYRGKGDKKENEKARNRFLRIYDKVERYLDKE